LMAAIRLGKIGTCAKRARVEKDVHLVVLGQNMERTVRAKA